jgi:hypothetical protein
MVHLENTQPLCRELIAQGEGVETGAEDDGLARTPRATARARLSSARRLRAATNSRKRESALTKLGVGATGRRTGIGQAG